MFLSTLTSSWTTLALATCVAALHVPRAYQDIPAVVKYQWLRSNGSSGAAVVPRAQTVTVVAPTSEIAVSPNTVTVASPNTVTVPGMNTVTVTQVAAPAVVPAQSPAPAVLTVTVSAAPTLAAMQTVTVTAETAGQASPSGPRPGDWFLGMVNSGDISVRRLCAIYPGQSPDAVVNAGGSDPSDRYWPVEEQVQKQMLLEQGSLLHSGPKHGEYKELCDQIHEIDKDSFNAGTQFQQQDMMNRLSDPELKTILEAEMMGNVTFEQAQEEIIKVQNEKLNQTLEIANNFQDQEQGTDGQQGQAQAAPAQPAPAQPAPAKPAPAATPAPAPPAKAQGSPALANGVPVTRNAKGDVVAASAPKVRRQVDDYDEEDETEDEEDEEDEDEAPAVTTPGYQSNGDFIYAVAYRPYGPIVSTPTPPPAPTVTAAVQPRADAPLPPETTPAPEAPPLVPGPVPGLPTNVAFIPMKEAEIEKAVQTIGFLPPEDANAG